MATPTRVLIVDDEPSVLEPAAKILRRAGYHVDGVGTAAAGLAAIVAAADSEPYDLLLSDIYLPDDRELQFLDALAERVGATLPVVLMTGQPSVPTAVQALRAGVVDYLVKPFDADQLLSTIDRAMEQVRAMKLVRDAKASVEAWVDTIDSVGQLVRRAAGRGPTTAGLPPGALGGDHDDPLGERPVVFDPEFLSRARAALAEMSPRQREIVSNLAAGKRIDDIAKGLFISPHTVRNHLKAIFRKLGVHSQVELVALVNRSGSA
jgi:DNA-binding NarL/FixJ family response regulator